MRHNVIKMIGVKISKILPLLILFLGFICYEKVVFAQDTETVPPLHHMVDTGKLLNTSFGIKFKKSLQEPSVNVFKLAGFSVFRVGAGVFLHNFQKHAWWSGQSGPFHIQNDW